MASQQKIPAETNNGSIREGSTIKQAGGGLSFQIPEQWVKWHQENKLYPNLHLSISELSDIRTAEGEWDKEFSMVVNAILPFDSCIAHVGGEGWGLKGMSYADLQVRAYVLEKTTPEEVEKLMRSKGSEVVSAFTGAPAVSQMEQSGQWNRITLAYPRHYQDYGATAMVDLRIRMQNGHMIVFAFMYTNHKEQNAIIDAILDSVRFQAPR